MSKSSEANPLPTTPHNPNGVTDTDRANAILGKQHPQAHIVATALGVARNEGREEKISDVREVVGQIRERAAMCLREAATRQGHNPDDESRWAYCEGEAHAYESAVSALEKWFGTEKSK